MDELFSQFQLSFVPVVIKRSSLPRRSRPNDSLRTWTSLSTCTTVYNDVHPSEWMRTPGPRALPPWPTTWPPPPCPWTTGSPRRCSTSSSRGAEGEQRITYPTLAAVHVYSQLMLSILYHSYANKDRSCLYLTPSTYLRIVVPVPGFRLGVTAFNNAGVLTRYS